MTIQTFGHKLLSSKTSIQSQINISQYYPKYFKINITVTFASNNTAKCIPERKDEREKKKKKKKNDELPYKTQATCLPQNF